MANTQTVIIDFQADFSSVQDAVDILEKTGKVDAELAATFRKTNQEINKQGQALDKTAKQGQQSTQSFSKLADLMKQFPKSGMQRFLLQVGNELAAAGFQAKDFYKKLDPKETLPKITSLRQELKLVKEQMQQAALAGGVLSDEYKKLKQRAGELDDTIKDVASDIANAGSDTRGIDNVVGSITALAGGFSAVQGAAALFGDESEEVQKALLKVNAAMALATGLQQVSIAVQKEGALARIADTAATYGQIAVQKIYTFVTGRATAATVAFKVALAATGIGLVIVGVIALANAFKRSTKDIDDATESIERQNRALESMNGLIDRRLNIDLALAEKAGKAQSDLTRLEGIALQQRVKNLNESSRLLADQRDGMRDVNAQIKLNNQIEENNTKVRDLNNEITVKGINLETQLANERKANADKAREAAEKQKQLNDKALAEARKQRALEFEDFKAGVELKLLAAERGSVEELELRKKLALASLMIDLEAEDITNNQKKLAIQQFFKEKADLEKSFNKAIVDQSLADEKNRLSAQLENLNLSESEKLEVRIAFLQISAAQEIEEADKNASKIKAINAKLNADIAAAKIESIRKIANDELALSGATGGIQRRALERVSQDEKLKGDIRINAIRQLAQIETASIDRQIKANRDAAAIQGADQKALEIEYETLLDQKAAKSEETEKKITDINAAENKKRQENDIAYIQATIGGLQQIGDIIGSIQSNEQEATQHAIETRRREVEELLETGAITEKEARERNRRINEEERQAKQRAAQQQKNLAVFQALLAIPQAYIAGLTAPFPIGGPIYGAILAGIAATQAAVIASRPVPKFATGKKGTYKGIGEVGEVGAELIQRADGSMEVATKRSLVYLGAQDKVFTHAETKRMLPFVNRAVMDGKSGVEKFDYNKLAKAVGKGSNTTVNIDKEFISESVANGLMKVNYFDRYYNSKG